MKTAAVDVEINVKDAMKIAQVDGKTIRRWVQAGLVVGRKIGEGRTSAYLVSKQSLLTHLKSKGEQPGS